MSSQFAYCTGGSCINALLKMQHTILGAFDNAGNKAVRLLTMDFSKALENVWHHLLVEKLKITPLSLPMVNG